MDSASAVGVLIKAYSKTPMLAMIAGAFWSIATSWNIAVWIVQLPSRLNPSDRFSRGSRVLAVEHGWTEAEAGLPDPAEWRFLRHAFQRHMQQSSAVAAEGRAKRLTKQYGFDGATSYKFWYKRLVENTCATIRTLSVGGYTCCSPVALACECLPRCHLGFCFCVCECCTNLREV